MATMTVEWKPGDPLPKGKTDQARVDMMTEAEKEQNALDDPDSLPMTEEEWAKFQHVTPDEEN